MRRAPAQTDSQAPRQRSHRRSEEPLFFFSFSLSSESYVQSRPEFRSSSLRLSVFPFSRVSFLSRFLLPFLLLVKMENRHHELRAANVWQSASVERRRRRVLRKGALFVFLFSILSPLVLCGSVPVSLDEDQAEEAAHRAFESLTPSPPPHEGYEDADARLLDPQIPVSEVLPLLFNMDQEGRVINDNSPNRESSGPSSSPSSSSAYEQASRLSKFFSPRPEKKLTRKELEANVKKSLGPMIDDLFLIFIKNVQELYSSPVNPQRHSAPSASPGISSRKEEGEASASKEEEEEETSAGGVAPAFPGQEGEGQNGQHFFGQRSLHGAFYSSLPYQPRKEDAAELFSLLLQDHAAFALWRLHFSRHLVSRLADLFVRRVSQEADRALESPPQQVGEGGEEGGEGNASSVRTVREEKGKEAWRGAVQQTRKEVDASSSVPGGGGGAGGRLTLLDVLFLEGREVFWDSRPASSQAAVTLIKRRMKELEDLHKNTLPLSRSASEEAETDNQQRKGRDEEQGEWKEEDEEEGRASAATASPPPPPPPVPSGSIPAWVPEVSPRFKSLSIKDAKALMGTFLVHYPVQVEGKKIPVTPVSLPPRSYSSSSSSSPLPEQFDSREAFPFCKDVIGHVRDQGDCGSCWAFASTEALNDRTCVRSQGEAKRPHAGSRGIQRHCRRQEGAEGEGGEGAYTDVLTHCTCGCTRICICMYICVRVCAWIMVKPTESNCLEEERRREDRKREARKEEPRRGAEDGGDAKRRRMMVCRERGLRQEGLVSGKRSACMHVYLSLSVCLDACVRTCVCLVIWSGMVGSAGGMGCAQRDS